MSLFHRNVNQLLSSHLFDLENVGLLKDDWYWDRQKIGQMQKIDSKLLQDLIELYKLHILDKSKCEQAIIEITKLQRVLKAILTQKLKSEQEKKAKVLVNKFIKDIEALISHIPIKIAVIGYIFQRFDSNMALEFILKTFDKIDRKYKSRSKVVIAQLINLGIPALAYGEAQKRGWETVGVAPSIAQTYKCFNVNQKIIKGNGWGDELGIIMGDCDILVCISSEWIHEEVCIEVKKDKKEVYQLKLKPQYNVIGDVFPIGQARGYIIRERNQLKDYVEVPLLKACQILYDKNVQVTETTANSEKLEYGAHIIINYDTLSEENKKIGAKFGKIGLHPDGFNALDLGIPLPNPNVKVKYLEDYFVRIALQFTHQKLTWIPVYTLSQLLNVYGIAPEKASNYKPKDYKQFYYDKSAKLFFLSKEHADKFKKQ